MKTTVRNILRACVLAALVLAIPQPTRGYSVLTHEAIIDQAWKDSIRPILLKRFPQATPEELRVAHAHAYGGAIILDLGYYPFGNKFFTDAVHYVRSGDFIEALLLEAQDLNEYAFALGSLAHYCADNLGHSVGVNRAVPIMYPKLRARHGNTVTYDEDPTAHLKTEFGFDVLQLARGRYAPEAHRDFIGFKVSKPVLERAFKRTYGLELKDIFANIDLAIGSFRRAVSTVIPQMTQVAWATKKDEIEKAAPGITREKFVYQVSREEYEKEWGSEYEKPGVLDKTLAFVFRVIPKVGPFRALAFRVPTPEAERLFLESFDETLTRYRALLTQARTGKLDLQNMDLDTGEPTQAGEYKPADETYADLLNRLASKEFENVTPELRQDILAFYVDLNAPIATRKDKKDWRDTLRALDQLKAAPIQAAERRQRSQ